MSMLLENLSRKMKEIDFAMLATHSGGGAIGSRLISNNREVDYDGSAWFFTEETTLMVSDFKADPAVNLSYQGKSGLFSRRPFFLAVQGTAMLIRDKDQFETHWTIGLEKWWPQGPQMPGLVLLKVIGERAHYWDGEEEGELLLEGAH